MWKVSERRDLNDKTRVKSEDHYVSREDTMATVRTSAVPLKRYYARARE